MRILPFGSAALLVEPASEAADDEAALAAVLALHAAVDAAPPRGVLELVPAARTLLLRLAADADPRGLAAALRSLRPDPAALPPGPLVELPVRYDGDDLDPVAGLLGLSREALIARHAAPEYRVAFVGFAPGFGYLAGGDRGLVVPRRADPRPRIPAGSVAVAGAYSGVYPRASPGGWQLLGSTEAVLWDERREPPALLRPGTRVRFTATRATARAARPAQALDASRTFAASPPGDRPHPIDDAPQVDRPRADDARQPAAPRRPFVAPGGAERALEVLAPGGRSLLQDLGRPGLAALGVAPAGALDRAAVRRANRIVGAPAGAAVIEHVLGGLRLRARGRMLVTVVGAQAPVTIDGEPAERDRALLLHDGAELAVGAPSRGVAVVVAVQGGIDIEPVLGSRSYDTLADLGPAPLAAGDLLPTGPAGRAAAALQESGARLPALGDLVELELLPGPRADWFEPEALRHLTEAPWTVSPRSDRIALRLEGPHPLERRPRRGGELASEGLVRGALQVPPDGRPVLFLADHPLTGGYPVIGVLSSRSLDLAGQCPPGAIVRFTQGVAPR